METSRTIRFGVFELDLTARELRRNGARVRLQDQPFEVLRALVERPGEVVSKEELRERIWTDDTYVDFDRSLATAVNKVRQALGDSATRPRFIETVPKRGYRFLADPLPPSQALGPSPRAPAKPVQLQPLAWISGLALVVAAGVALWAVFKPETDLRPPDSTAPLTAYPGSEVNPTLSPEGDRVVFAWDAGELPGQFDLYVQIVGQPNPQRLTTDPRDEKQAAWSPDGRWIAFLRALRRPVGFEHEVVLIPATGGPETVLAQLTTRGGSSLVWTPDSRNLLVVKRLEQSNISEAIFRLDIETREQTQLTKPPPGLLDGHPAISPDGRRLAFSRGFIYVSELFESRLDPESGAADDPRPLTQERGTLKLNPVYWQNVLLYEWRNFSQNSSQLRVVGSRLPFLLSGSDFAVSRSNRRLVFVRRAVEVNLWRVGLDNGRRAVGDPRPFIASSQIDIFPDYSPDGTRIAFQSDRDGAYHVWLCNAEGGAARRLTALSSDGSPRWSPDGSTIAFDSTSEGQFGIYVIDANGGLAREVTATGHAPAWSPDGRWIYFSDERSGDAQVWRIREDGSDPEQVTFGGGERPRMGKGDGFVYYHHPEDHAVWRKSVEGDREEPVIPDVIDAVAFQPSQGGVFYARRGPGEGDIEVAWWDSDSGETTPIGLHIPDHGLLVGLTVSPDEKWLIFRQAEPLREDLMLAEWRE